MDNLSGWQGCFVLFAKVSTTGEKIVGNVMRRLVEGAGYEYRRMTAQERTEFADFGNGGDR